MPDIASHTIGIPPSGTVEPPEDDFGIDDVISLLIGGGQLLGLIPGLQPPPKKEFDPFRIPSLAFANQRAQDTLIRELNVIIGAGGTPDPKDLRRLDKLIRKRDKLERRFLKRQVGRPQAFRKAGIPQFIPLDALLSLLLQQQAQAPNLLPQAKANLDALLAAGIDPFQVGQLQLLTGPIPQPVLLQGGNPVPFVTTPSFGSGSGGLDFGGFGTGFGGLLGSVIAAGGQIGSALLAPKQQQVQQAQFVPQQASLIPSIGGGIARLGRGLFPSLPAIGGGVVGGELADAFQNLFRSGGAATQDDSAAFTDPIPGACRPKAHLKVNPCTGKEVWFSPRGRPMLFSGDLATCKRVARVNKRVQKAIPSKHHHHRRAKR